MTIAICKRYFKIKRILSYPHRPHHIEFRRGEKYEVRNIRRDRGTCIIVSVEKTGITFGICKVREHFIII